MLVITFVLLHILVHSPLLEVLVCPSEYLGRSLVQLRLVGTLLFFALVHLTELVFMFIVFLVILVHDIAPRNIAVLALVELPALLIDCWLEVFTWDCLLHDPFLVVLSLLLIELLLAVYAQVIELLVYQLNLLVSESKRLAVYNISKHDHLVDDDSVSLMSALFHLVEILLEYWFFKFVLVGLLRLVVKD